MLNTNFLRPAPTQCSPTRQNVKNHIDNKSVNTPLTNIFATKEGWDITLHLAGFSKEDIEISNENNMLTIKGQKPSSDENYTRREWSNDEIKRSYTLPQNAEIEKIKAEMKNGLLTIFIPKKLDKVVSIPIQ